MSQGLMDQKGKKKREKIRKEISLMRKIFPGYLEDLDTSKVHVSETNMQTHCLI